MRDCISSVKNSCTVAQRSKGFVTKVISRPDLMRSSTFNESSFKTVDFHNKQGSRVFFSLNGKQNGFRQSQPGWPGSFLDSPTMRNVLSGLCFNDHATDAQEPCCLARTYHRAGGGAGDREGDRHRVLVSVVLNISTWNEAHTVTGAASLALSSIIFLLEVWL